MELLELATGLMLFGFLQFHMFAVSSIILGVDAFNPFQPEVMDVFEIKRQYGRDLTFYGGISIQRTLPFGTVPQVRDEVRRLIDLVGESGGYIASPSHDIPGDAKPENIAAMIEVLQNQ